MGTQPEEKLNSRAASLPEKFNLGRYLEFEVLDTGIPERIDRVALSEPGDIFLVTESSSMFRLDSKNSIQYRFKFTENYKIGSLFLYKQEVYFFDKGAKRVYYTSAVSMDSVVYDISCKVSSICHNLSPLSSLKLIPDSTQDFALSSNGIIFYIPESTQDKLHICNTNFNSLFSISIDTTGIVSTSHLNSGENQYFILLYERGALQMVDVSNIIYDDESTEMRRIRYELYNTNPQDTSELNEKYVAASIDQHGSLLAAVYLVRQEALAFFNVGLYKVVRTEGSIDILYLNTIQLETDPGEKVTSVHAESSDAVGLVHLMFSTGRYLLYTIDTASSLIVGKIDEFVSNGEIRIKDASQNCIVCTHNSTHSTDNIFFVHSNI